MRTITGSRYPRLLLTLLVCCLFLLSSVVTFAQSTTDGAIGGTVVDPQDKVVSGASITIHNNGNNQDVQVKSDSTGFFRVQGLQPTVYTVTVTAQGFATYKAEKVQVVVGSLTTLTPHLTIGTTEQVDVTAETPAINTSSSEFAPVLDEKQIHELPINGGRWSSFAVLTPGVVNNSSGFGLLSFRGMSTVLNNVTVDGADNNQAFFSEERGRTRAGYSTAKVAVQEFQVNTSNYSAEYGRSAGGVVNTVTKSGTNQFHGELYGYDRDNEWGSMNPFTTIPVKNSSGTYVNVPYKPKDWRKMAGFGVGGPIIKDRLFFFFAYDYFKRNFPGTAVASSPSAFWSAADTAAPKTTAGVATTCSGSGLTSPDSSACAMATALYGGTANYATAAAAYNTQLFGGTGTGALNLGLISMTGTVPRTGEQIIFFPKVDWIVNAKNHAFFELNRMRWASPAGIQTQGTNTYGSSSFGNDYVKDTWGVVKLDSMITNSISNQLRTQYGRDFEYENNQAPTSYEKNLLLSTSAGYTNPNGIPPQVSITNGFTFGTPTFLNRAKYPDEHTLQIADTVNYIHGKHAIKAGVDFMRAFDQMINMYTVFGSYSYTSLGSYFIDLLSPYQSTPLQTRNYSSYSQAFGPLGFKFHTSDYALFAQDDWKLTRRLTVNLGVRWEYEQLPKPFSALVNPNISQTASMPNDKNNFGPRAGFALDVFGDGKTALRGGVGMYYGRILNGTVYSALTSTGMSAGQVTYSYNTTNGPNGTGCPSAIYFPYVINSSTCTPTQATSSLLSVNSGGSAVYFHKGFQNPQIYEYDLVLQQQLTNSMVLSVSYLGSIGHELPGFRDDNLGNPATITYSVSNSTYTDKRIPYSGTVTQPFYFARPNQKYGTMTDIYSGLNSNYNALAVQLQRKMTHHVQFSANYTWSHALDYGVNGATSTDSNDLYDPTSLKGEYGNSMNDVRQRFTFNSIIELPWTTKGWTKYLTDGWQIAPMFQAQTGLPYSMTSNGTPKEWMTQATYQALLSPSTYAMPSTANTYTVNGTTYYLVSGVGGGLNGSYGSYRLPGTTRNAYRYPSTYVVDLRLSKSFKFAERYGLTLSGEAFNLFNHRNVTGVASTNGYNVGSPTAKASLTSSNIASNVGTDSLSLNTGTLPNGSTGWNFGIPNSANSNFVYSTRQIQIGARFTF
ncbi:MAG: TonB-dependent receptor [Terracidiphilus sp.]|nr:TonB-dependent receptor [Terracidiphilus sp.]